MNYNTGNKVDDLVPLLNQFISHIEMKKSRKTEDIDQIANNLERDTFNALRK